MARRSIHTLIANLRAHRQKDERYSCSRLSDAAKCKTVAVGSDLDDRVSSVFAARGKALAE